MNENTYDKYVVDFIHNIGYFTLVPWIFANIFIGLYLLGFSGSLKGSDGIKDNIIAYITVNRVDLLSLISLGSVTIGVIFVFCLSLLLQRFIKNNRHISNVVITLGFSIVVWFVVS